MKACRRTILSVDSARPHWFFPSYVSCQPTCNPPFSETFIRRSYAACGSSLGGTPPIAEFGRSLLYVESHSAKLSRVRQLAAVRLETLAHPLLGTISFLVVDVTRIVTVNNAIDRE